MKLSYVLVFVGILVALLAVMAWAAPGKSGSATTVSPGTSDEKGGAFTASEVFYDFGIISMKNGLVNRVFKVTNSTDKDVELKTVTTSCMCTAAYIVGIAGEKGPFGMPGMGSVPPANELIKAGESRDIKVVYDPNAHGPAGVGAIDRFVYLTDEAGGTLALEIKAMVTP